MRDDDGEPVPREDHGVAGDDPGLRREVHVELVGGGVDVGVCSLFELDAQRGACLVGEPDLHTLVPLLELVGHLVECLGERSGSEDGDGALAARPAARRHGDDGDARRGQPAGEAGSSVPLMAHTPMLAARRAGDTGEAHKERGTPGRLCYHGRRGGD